MLNLSPLVYFKKKYRVNSVAFYETLCAMLGTLNNQFGFLQRIITTLSVLNNVSRATLGLPCKQSSVSNITLFTKKAKANYNLPVNYRKEKMC